MKKRIHLIGIGGIGMSAIARMYLSMGHAVQGSDVKKSVLLTQLEQEGAKIFIGHEASHVDRVDWVVYSSSIAAKHIERQAAIKNGLRLVHRAKALAEICDGRFTIAVSGTHGKTTTTALIGMILKEAGRDPSIVIGGLVNLFGGNACYGNGREIVIEADESDSSFLEFSPALEVITNIEKEHMDHFKTTESIESAYRKFIGRLPKGAEWFGCAEDEAVLKMAAEKIRPVFLYGFKPMKKGVYATDIVECPSGRRGISFVAHADGKKLGVVEMKILGRHNVLNALAAIGVGVRLGVSFSTMKDALEKYEGAARRFDVKYEDSRFLVVDDYAHHPTEIQKTLTAAKALNKKRIVALFQPHRYSRTRSLLQEFSSSFSDADKLVVTDIYAASEAPQADISGAKLCRQIQNLGHKDAVFVERAKVARYVRDEIRPGDLVMVLGAGDITQVASELSDFLKEAELGLFSKIRGKVLNNEPLSSHTSLRVGGPAQFWIEPEDAEDLKATLVICRQNGLKAHVFGSGSNLLPPDEGLRGAAIYLGAPYFRELWIEDDKIVARAGVPNSLFIQYAVEKGYGGCEFLLGIPGGIGGSIAMNAGSHNQSIDTFLESVQAVRLSGEEVFLRKKDIPFSYRASGIKDAIILEGTFRLPKQAGEVSQEKLNEYRDYRFRTQDLQHASAGCMFKNPIEGNSSSGKLIEESGLKGRKVGRAQVSTKHANFIINLGGASAKDILALIQEVRDTVKKKFNVELETEVKIL